MHIIIYRGCKSTGRAQFISLLLDGSFRLRLLRLQVALVQEELLVLTERRINIDLFSFRQVSVPFLQVHLFGSLDLKAIGQGTGWNGRDCTLAPLRASPIETLHRVAFPSLGSIVAACACQILPQ